MHFHACRLIRQDSVFFFIHNFGTFHLSSLRCAFHPACACTTTLVHLCMWAVRPVHHQNAFQPWQHNFGIRWMFTNKTHTHATVVDRTEQCISTRPFLASACLALYPYLDIHVLYSSLWTVRYTVDAGNSVHTFSGYSSSLLHEFHCSGSAQTAPQSTWTCFHRSAHIVSCKSVRTHVYVSSIMW